MDKILIADDNELNRDILSEMLSDSYEIVLAENGVQALNEMHEHLGEFSLLLLDLVMPEVDGFGVLEKMREYHWIESLPVIIISSETAPEIIRKAFDYGATDFVNRPFDAYVVRRRVHNTISLHNRTQRLSNAVVQQAVESEKESRLMVGILSHIVEFRNGESGMHVMHVQAITRQVLNGLCRVTDRYRLDEKEIDLITLASALHDVGKISIASEILNKPGRLTNEEYAVMKTHCAIGADMLESMSEYQNSELLRYAGQICRYHHERSDGRGYPEGLKGYDIPVSAQAVALADVYDALTSVRCYKAAYTHEQAVQMILNGECGAFNPEILDCLRLMEKEIQAAVAQQNFGDYTDDGMPLANKILAGENHVMEEVTRSYKLQRMINDALSDLYNSMRFEYSRKPDYLRFSSAAAARLGMKHHKLVNVEDYKPFMDLASAEDHALFQKALDATTREKPDYALSAELHLPEGPRTARVSGRTLWLDSDPDTWAVAVGVLEFE